MNIFGLLILCVCFCGCKSELKYYSVKQVAEKTFNGFEFNRHYRILYYGDKIIRENIGFYSLSPDAQKVVYEHIGRLVYSEGDIHKNIELLEFSIPKNVQWEKDKLTLVLYNGHRKVLPCFIND